MDGIGVIRMGPMTMGVVCVSKRLSHEVQNVASFSFIACCTLEYKVNYDIEMLHRSP